MKFLGKLFGFLSKGNPVTALIGQGVKAFADNRKQKNAAKYEWSARMAKGADGSFKDELWTIIFALPIAFIVAGAVADSFGYYAVSEAGLEMVTRLNLLMGDGNYPYIVGTLVFASVGLRWDQKRRKNNLLGKHLENQKEEREKRNAED